MANQGEKPRTDEELEEFCKKKTWDGSQSKELERLRARCASDTMEFKRSTVRIPLNKEDVAEMKEKDFIQYIVSTIETARFLVLEVLEKSDESKVFSTEWSEEIEVDEENFDIEIRRITDHVNDRIKSIDALSLLSHSREASKDFAYSKELLEEVKEKLIQRRRSQRTRTGRY